jgi:5'-nucleotidase
MRILLTNDDGIHAPGIAALKAEMAPLGEVTIVAPDAERSATAHSITLDRPLRVREVYVADTFLGFSVDGSPADCVKLGVKEILQAAPDLVLSGINLGSNVGINVLYSGTVAAGLEGAILGVTSVAVSLAASKKPDFRAAARIAAGVIRQILAAGPPRGSLFNLNIPTGASEAIRGVRLARQSTISYEDGFDVRVDPRGGKYFWMTGELNKHELPPDCDAALLAEGFVTLTPLHYDLTDGRLLDLAAGWKIRLDQAPPVS